jgi:chromosome segregation ATPase
MKSIFYGVAILVACGAAYFSFDLSNKFQALQVDRLATIDDKDKTTALAEAADTDIKKERALLVSAEEKKDLLEQSVSNLKSAGSSLKAKVETLQGDLKAQDVEFDALNKALEEVNKTLGDIAAGVTLESLPEKIQEIEADKAAKDQKLAELVTLNEGAEKTLASSRAELDRLGKRKIDRSSRIARNSMGAVVTAVNQDWGFLVIGAGSNSGFTPQTALLVERDGRKIGRVRPSAIESTRNRP